MCVPAHRFLSGHTLFHFCSNNRMEILKMCSIEHSFLLSLSQLIFESPQNFVQTCCLTGIPDIVNPPLAYCNMTAEGERQLDIIWHISQIVPFCMPHKLFSGRIIHSAVSTGHSQWQITVTALCQFHVIAVVNHRRSYYNFTHWKALIQAFIVYYCDKLSD